MNITEFLEARIADDEVAAHKLALTDLRPVLSIASTVNHPARILAECAAKRAIIEMVRPYLVYQSTSGTSREFLQVLAAVYKDHPDYNQGWAL